MDNLVKENKKIVLRMKYFREKNILNSDGKSKFSDGSSYFSDG